MMRKLLALGVAVIFICLANYSTALFFPVVDDARILALEKRLYQHGNMILEELYLNLDAKKERVTFISHFYTKWINLEFSKDYQEKIFREYPDSRSNRDLVMVCMPGAQKSIFLKADTGRPSYWVITHPLKMTKVALSLLLIEQTSLRAGRILGVKKLVWENGHFFRRTPGLFEVIGYLMSGAFSFPPVGKN